MHLHCFIVSKNSRNACTFSCVKIFGWKSGRVNFLTNLMSAGDQVSPGNNRPDLSLQVSDQGTQQDAPVQLLRPLQPHPGLLLVLQLVDDRVVDGAILHPPEDVLVETCRNMFQRLGAKKSSSTLTPLSTSSPQFPHGCCQGRPWSSRVFLGEKEWNLTCHPRELCSPRGHHRSSSARRSTWRCRRQRPWVRPRRRSSALIEKLATWCPLQAVVWKIQWKGRCFVPPNAKV